MPDIEFEALIKARVGFICARKKLNPEEVLAHLDWAKIRARRSTLDATVAIKEAIEAVQSVGGQ